VLLCLSLVGEKEQDSVYEVLFDEEFLGGLTIRLFATKILYGLRNFSHFWMMNWPRVSTICSCPGNTL